MPSSTKGEVCGSSSAKARPCLPCESHLHAGTPTSLMVECGRTSNVMLQRIAIASYLLSMMACSAGMPADLPLIEPPVRQATPDGFHEGASARRATMVDAMLSATEFRDRFFNPQGGPTDVFAILRSIDERLDEANAASADDVRPCLEQEPVSYELAPFGQSIPFAAKCYRTFSSSSGPAAFMQFGRVDDVTYVFITGGATRLAARVVAGADDAVVVDAWYGVGYTNATCGHDGTFDGCSYAATQIHAESASHAFEMTVAGIGVGYCGIQIRSDGTSIYGVGSTDMGMTCGAPATLCANATDLTAPGECSALTSFSLPALGRHAGAGAHEFGESHYPAQANIVLDGTSEDSLGFGPGDEPTPGVGAFD